MDKILDFPEKQRTNQLVKLMGKRGLAGALGNIVDAANYGDIDYDIKESGIISFFILCTQCIGEQFLTLAERMFRQQTGVIHAKYFCRCTRKGNPPEVGNRKDSSNRF